MNSSDSNLFRGILRTANQWLKKTPERALDEAYEAALKIKSIEDTHFNGGLINGETGNYSDSVRSLFLRDLNVYLETIKVRLIEFKASNSVVKIVNVASPSTLAIRLNPDDNDTNAPQKEDESGNTRDTGNIGDTGNTGGTGSTESGGEEPDIQTVDVINEQNIILKKLKFIDEVRTRYGATTQSSTALTRKAPNSVAGRSQTPRSSNPSALFSQPSSQGSSKVGPIRRLDDELVDRLTKKTSKAEA